MDRATLVLGLLVAALLLPAAAARAQGIPAFDPARAKSALGKAVPLGQFAFASQRPATWAVSTAASDDPSHRTRFEVVDGQARVSHRQPYTHAILMDLVLDAAPADRLKALEGWLRGSVMPERLTASERGWTFAEQTRTESTQPLPGGRRLTALVLVVAARPGLHADPVAVVLAGALLEGGGGHVLLGSALATSLHFRGLSPEHRAVVHLSFRAIAAQVVAVAGLGRIALPPRVPAVEQQLVQKGRFLHTARYASRVGALSAVSLAAYGQLEAVFHPDLTLTLRDDLSATFRHPRRDASAPPADDPRSRTGAATRVRFEVRQGSGGKHWLVIHPDSGTTFYVLDPAGTRRCGSRTVTGWAIGGRVEGVYTTLQGVCTHSTGLPAPRP